MVLNLEASFKTGLNSSELSLAYCWLITRRDGGQLGFTSLDIDLLINGITYQGVTGFDPTASQYSQGVENLDSQNLKGFLDASGISKRDLESGIYDFAEVRRFIVNYLDLPTSLDAIPPKHRELPRTYFGSYTSNNLGYDIQLKDELSHLDNQVGTITTKTCRDNLGGPFCQVDLVPYTHYLVVDQVYDRRKFAMQTVLPAPYFQQGRLLFATGANYGVWADIIAHVNDELWLYRPLPFELQPGDNFFAIAGCNRTKLDCIVRFQNFRRFLGEPDIPTTDLAINTPSG